MKQNQPFAVRLNPQTKSALEAAAAGKKIGPHTMAAQLLIAGLQREGYLPKVTRQAAREIQA